MFVNLLSQSNMHFAATLVLILHQMVAIFKVGQQFAQQILLQTLQVKCYVPITVLSVVDLKVNKF